MADNKTFIDSNILVYLVDKDITKKEKVLSLTTTESAISIKRLQKI
jgi:predicted nucleic acid-binding protein